jgi:ring-1,2-phenylacetyl-CoA epoxidase subunit PaaD
MVKLHSKEEIYEALEQIMDPEIPVLSILDLGMITNVQIEEAGIQIKMIPTFAACPAITYLQNQIQKQIQNQFRVDVNVIVDESVNWSTDRMRPEAHQKLKAFGIASFQASSDSSQGLELDASEQTYRHFLTAVPCTHCGSTHTVLRSPFGSTLCRATQYCLDCKQIFEQFKPLH